MIIRQVQSAEYDRAAREPEHRTDVLGLVHDIDVAPHIPVNHRNNPGNRCLPMMSIGTPSSSIGFLLASIITCEP